MTTLEEVRALTNNYNNAVQRVARVSEITYWHDRRHIQIQGDVDAFLFNQLETLAVRSYRAGLLREIKLRVCRRESVDLLTPHDEASLATRFSGGVHIQTFDGKALVAEIQDYLNGYLVELRKVRDDLAHQLENISTVEP